nr:hypothetical protein [Pseudomonas sp. UMAB-40]
MGRREPPRANHSARRCNPCVHL